MSKRTNRTCSFCHEPGHTKQGCVEAERAKKATKKQSTGKSVVIRVVHNSSSSPHIVNLKPHDAKQQIHVSAFREKMEKIQTAREPMDVAAIVRVANEQKRRHEERLTLKEALGKAEEERKHIYPSSVPKHTAIVPVSRGIIIEKEESKIPFDWSTWIEQKVDALIAPVGRAKERVHQLKRPTFSGQKFAVSFLVAVVLITLPFPTIGYYKKIQKTQVQVLNHSTTAFFALQASTIAALQSDLTSAEQDLNTALSAFSAAQDMVDKEHTVLQYVAGLVPMLGDQVRSRQHVLLAGHHLALGNTYLIKGIDAVSQNAEAPITDRMEILRTHLKSAMPQYEAALDDLGHIDPQAIPVEYQESFAEFKLLFAAFIDDMQDIADLIDVMNLVFGAEEFKRYLLVFQNNHEIRPTGGFMGSFAILDVQKGKIEKIEVPPGGTYDLRGQLDAYVKPPLPLQLVASRWEFQDANWFPDFAAAAQKMEWFYEHGRKTTVDGVIAINATVLERFLRVIGPVTTTSKYNLLLDADSVLTQIQHTVETGEDKKANKPKLIISELLNQFLGGAKDLSKVELLRLLSEVHQAADQKEIQVYMNDPVMQERLRGFGWTGEIARTPATQDYLMVVNANLQGQKSDARIEQDISYKVVVGEDGSMIAEARVKRTHTGTPSEAMYGALNVNYIRLLVPEGSELIDASGFSYPPDRLFHVPEDWYQEDPDLRKREEEIGIHVGSGTRVTKEFGKTAFGNWMMVEPGATAEAVFTYTLPFKVMIDQGNNSSTGLAGWKDKILDAGGKPSRYSLLLQKQSGIESAVHTSIEYPDAWQPVWKLHESLLLKEHSATYDADLVSDTAIGVVMEKIQ